MNDDFRYIFAKMKSGENISPEEFLTKVCGLSIEDAKKYIDSVKEAENVKR